MATEPGIIGAPTEQAGQTNHSPSADQPKKRGRFWRGLGIMTLLLAAGGGLYATQTQHGQDTVRVLGQAGKMFIAMKTNPDLIFQQAGGDHVNILLIGRDVNWKIGKVYDPKTKTFRSYQVHDESAKARSDTMIIVSLDKSRNTIRMVSLPRDARVYIPENDVDTGRNKLNAAHAFGGPQLLMRTLREELGITIHHYAVVKFEGFKKLIDQVGGITVNVDGALKRDRRTGRLYRGNLDYDDDWGDLHVHLKPGPQRMDGEKAHGYVRFRMDREGDPGRIRRQQQVMRALAKEIMHASPLAIPGLVKEVRHQFETDLKDDAIGSAADFARKIGNAGKIQPLTLFGVYSKVGGESVVLLNKPKNEKLLRTIFGPTFDPDRFLHRSPYTESGDEIGASNNANEAARAVLREAGLLKDGDALERPAELDAPVRVEPSREDEERGQHISASASAGASDGYSGRRRRRSRHADASASESSSARRASRSRDEADEERPRRRRSRRRRSTSSASRRERGSSDDSRRSDGNAATHDSSPIPVPETASGASSSSSAPADGGSSSPLPQPE